MVQNKVGKLNNKKFDGKDDLVQDIKSIILKLHLFFYRTNDNRAIDDLKSPAGKTDYHTIGACFEVIRSNNLVRSLKQIIYLEEDNWF